MARGRKPIVINKAEFQQVVSQLESEQKFENRTQLWAAVELTSWAKAQQPRPLTGQVAMLKAKELDITIQTPVGKRGREKGCGPIPGGGRKRKEIPEKSMEKILGGMPKKDKEKYSKTIERYKNGSLKAAVKLKCLDCSNWQPGEVAQCQVEDCFLYSHRPYKRPSVVKELEVL